MKKSSHPLKNIRLNGIFLLSSLTLVPQLLCAKGEVTQINAHLETTTQTSYDLRATHPDGSTGPHGIEHLYTWLGQNQVIDSFDYNGKTYNYDVEADNVVIRRVDNVVSTGERCTLFMEDESDISHVFKPEFPRLDNTNNCDMAAVMGGRIINRGALDVFNNGKGGHQSGRSHSATNIERVDFIFSGGVTAPYNPSLLASTGVVVTEKGANNDMIIAVVLSLDAEGKPSSYSKPILVHRRSAGGGTKYTYGSTNIAHTNRYVSNELHPIQNYPYVESPDNSGENLGMAFVDLDAFELTAGQVWYGFSYFSPDTGNGAAANALGQIDWKAEIDPVNYIGFPLDTDHSAAYGDADLYGGIGGYFVDSELNNISGVVYKDDNTNGIFDSNEAGISKIKVTLYKDNNGDGSIQLSDTEYPSINTDTKGNYNFTGVLNGDYLVVIDNNDADLPNGYTLNQAEAISISINNVDSTNNNYAYISQHPMLAEYRFDKCDLNGITAEDSSGNNYHGAITGIVDTNTDAIIIRSGHFKGGAVDSNLTEINTTYGAKTTASFWMYWNGSEASGGGQNWGQVPISWGEGFDSYNLHVDVLRPNENTTLQIGFNTHESDNYGIDIESYALGWHHIVAVFNNGDVTGSKIYLDGVAQVLEVTPNRPHLNYRAYVNKKLRIGGIKNSDQPYAFKDFLDEVKIYNRELSLAEISSIYDNERIGKSWDGTTRQALNCNILTIDKTVTPTTAAIGENIVYTITIKNNSNSEATGVKVVDVLSSAVTYISDDANGAYNSASGLWDVGSIPQNDNKQLKITVRVNN